MADDGRDDAVLYGAMEGHAGPANGVQHEVLEGHKPGQGVAGEEASAAGIQIARPQPAGYAAAEVAAGGVQTGRE